MLPFPDIKKYLFYAIVMTCLLAGKVAAQPNIFDPSDPVRVYDIYNPPPTPMNTLLKWYRTPRMSWNTDRFKAYYWNGMAFRLRFPNGYDPSDVNKKYPVIIFLHGDGESRQPSDNEYQLLIGGELFEEKVNAGQFDGFIMFPQKIGFLWDEYFTSINHVLDSLQKYCNADPDRVIPMGLSSGGIGALRYAAEYPQRTATVVASSPPFAQTLVDAQNANLHVPIWIASGSADNLPDTPSVLKYTNAFSNKGGDVRYTLFQGKSHNIWYEHWAEPYLVPYWNAAHKANPLIFFQRNQFCSPEVITARLGITAGFYAYEWQKDSVTIAIGTNGNNTITDSSSAKDFTGHELSVKAFGAYRVRFKRSAVADWSVWSPNPAVISPRACNPLVNETPQARAGADEGIILPANNFRLSGLSSYDPDGLIVSYNWSQAAGSSQAVITNADSAVSKPDSLKPGYYVFQLTVTDNKGATATDDLLIIVDAEPPANKVPVAIAGNDVNLTLPANFTFLNGNASNDPDGSIITYSWLQISGPFQPDLGNTSFPFLNVYNLVIGTYVFRLAVTDNKGAISFDDVTVNVYSGPEGNQSPRANAGNDITVFLPANTATLTGSTSSDPDGYIRDYRWSFVSGPSGYAISNDYAADPIVSNLREGVYVFRLLVIDNNGATTTDDVTVTVMQGIVLSVDFLSFSATVINNTTALQWATGQENNSSHFIVEHSINGLTYDSIGRVLATGNINRVTNYAFLDVYPASGNNYYRLKQVDKNGTYTYSAVQMANRGNVFTYRILQNPVYDQLKLSIHAPKPEKLQVQIREAGGRLVLQRDVMLSQGSSTLTVPVATLSNGSYVITFRGGDRYESGFFTKQ